MERKLGYLQEKGARTWLAAMLSCSCSTVLYALEFWDDLREQCCLPLLEAPEHCDGCDAKFSLAHSLAYKIGSLATSRYGESRDALACLASAGPFHQVLAMNQSSILVAMRKMAKFLETRQLGSPLS